MPVLCRNQLLHHTLAESPGRPVVRKPRRYATIDRFRMTLPGKFTSGAAQPCNGWLTLASAVAGHVCPAGVRCHRISAMRPGLRLSAVAARGPPPGRDHWRHAWRASRGGCDRHASGRRHHALIGAALRPQRVEVVTGIWGTRGGIQGAAACRELRDHALGRVAPQLLAGPRRECLH
jgi:hypothetical protein